MSFLNENYFRLKKEKNWTQKFIIIEITAALQVNVWPLHLLSSPYINISSFHDRCFYPPIYIYPFLTFIYNIYPLFNLRMVTTFVLELCPKLCKEMQSTNLDLHVNGPYGTLYLLGHWMQLQ